MQTPQHQRQTQEIVIPCKEALEGAVKQSYKHDKPILLDYYRESANGKVILLTDKNSKSKHLFKSKDEFTSECSAFGRAGKDAIFITANSIYITAWPLQQRIADMTPLLTRDDDDDDDNHP